MPAAHAIVEHRLPGRLRLRMPARRGAADYFAALVACLAEHPDVEEVHADPRTAGVLVLHRGEAEAILGSERARALIELQSPPAEPDAAPATAAADVPSVNALLAAALGLLGGVQLLRGHVLGPASEMLWNAYALANVLRGGPLMPLVGLAILVKLVQGPALGSASSLFFYALAAREMARAEEEKETGPDSPRSDAE